LNERPSPACKTFLAAVNPAEIPPTAYRNLDYYLNAKNTRFSLFFEGKSTGLVLCCTKSLLLAPASKTAPLRTQRMVSALPVFDSKLKLRPTFHADGFMQLLQTC
jgi:hypothetical protein